MLNRAISRTKFPFFASIFVHDFIKATPIMQRPIPAQPETSIFLPYSYKSFVGLCLREYHDGRPRGPLWRGKKLIGKEALFVISGLKRFKDDEEKLDKFIKNHVLRLLKMDMIAVLTELERQEEVALALKMFSLIQKQDWYKPDIYLYKDLIIALARCKMMDEVMLLWEDMRKEDLFPDSQTYTEVIRGYLKHGSPADAMNVYEDMLKSPDPPEELPFRILLKGLLPHPLLRNKVKKDFEELFPEHHVYDPPEEIFGMQ
ncbi:Protein THYLAKOID ASSEMBLY 8-like, chloroplastic [Ancistrocladus abbreviatus]